jgi:hypothetical protein
MAAGEGALVLSDDGAVDDFKVLPQDDQRHLDQMGLPPKGTAPKQEHLEGRLGLSAFE